MEFNINKIIRIIVIIISIILILNALITGTVGIIGYCLGWLCAAIWAGVGLFPLQ